MNTPASLRSTIKTCLKCPRLVRHQNALKKINPDYHCAPVVPWGVARPRLLIVGLAPGLQGAGRTGKGFVGDASGAFLFSSLYEHGFSSSSEAERARLRGTVITNIVKCLPPKNLPLGIEKRQCEGFLRQELAQFFPGKKARPRVVLCLGKDAYDGVVRVTGAVKQTFAHNRCIELANNFYLVSSFHPSRLNVNTGRLTRAMFNDMFSNINALLDGSPSL